MNLDLYTYSLIIPHYNNPNALIHLLQTVPIRDDLQILVVDDCSPEATQEKLKEIKQLFPKVEFYSTGINGGGGKARNIGLQHSRGKFLIFADGDDYFENNFNELLNRFKNREFDIVYFSVYFEDEDDSTRTANNYKHLILEKAVKSGKECDLKFQFTQPWGKIIRRDLVEANSIQFEESIVSNDVKFSTLVDFHSNIAIPVLDQCYVYRLRNSSTSRNLNPKKILIRLEIDLKRHNFLKQNNIADKMDYLANLNLIYSSHDIDLISNAFSLCRKYDASYSKIFILSIKYLLRRIIKK